MVDEQTDSAVEIEFFSTGFLNETTANYNETELDLMTFNSSIFFDDSEFNFFDDAPTTSVNPVLLALPVVALIILAILLVLCVRRKSAQNALEKVDPEMIPS